MGDGLQITVNCSPSEPSKQETRKIKGIFLWDNVTVQKGLIAYVFLSRDFEVFFFFSFSSSRDN